MCVGDTDDDTVASERVCRYVNETLTSCTALILNTFMYIYVAVYSVSRSAVLLVCIL